MRAIAMAIVGVTFIWFSERLDEDLLAHHHARDFWRKVSTAAELVWFLATLICIIGGW